jgi:hypothetical protein
LLVKVKMASKQPIMVEGTTQSGLPVERVVLFISSR